MAKLLKLRRGTTSQHSSFTGAEGEVTVDTDKETLVVHNGAQAGGYPLARADGTGTANFTITGELDAATGDFSGNVDIDGTCEADAYTVNGTALDTHIAGVTVTNATNSAHVLVTDNESTNEENLITFVEGATDSTGNVGLEMDGNLSYNPSTGTITSTIFKGNVDAVDIDVDGTANLDAVDIDGDVDLAGDLTFSGAARDIKLLDNTASALDITEAGNSYMSFTTTNGTENITVTKACVGNIATHGTTTGNIAFDFAAGNNQQVTLTGNPTFTQPSNQTPGQSGSIFIIQDGTGSRVAASWHADYKWGGGSSNAPTLTTAANAVDRIDYVIQANNKIHAVASLNVS